MSNTHAILSSLNRSANRGALGLTLLVSIIAGIIIIADHSLARVERAYEVAGRV